MNLIENNPAVAYSSKVIAEIITSEEEYDELIDKITDAADRLDLYDVDINTVKLVEHTIRRTIEELIGNN